jgi:hypothetical protein
MENKILEKNFQNRLNEIFTKSVLKHDSYGVDIDTNELNDYELISGFIPFFEERYTITSIIGEADYWSLKEETQKEWDLAKYDEYFNAKWLADEDSDNEINYTEVYLKVCTFSLIDGKRKAFVELWITTPATYFENEQVDVCIEPKEYDYELDFEDFDEETVLKETENILNRFF